MISIIKAREEDNKVIVSIGQNSVAEAHKGSCPQEDLDAYIAANYNDAAIKSELNNSTNIYHILYYHDKAVGFSKIILNAQHNNIKLENAAKLDRIYLLNDYQGLKLGFELLKHNVDFAKNNGQTAIWLYTWTGNSKAINFYNKFGFEVVGSHNFYVTPTSSNLNHQMLLSFK